MARADPARAVPDRIPQQFVGNWCYREEADPATRKINEEEGIVTYKRSNRCKPEGQVFIQSDRYAEPSTHEPGFNCKFLETVSITRHGTHRIKFWCKSSDPSFNDPGWFLEVYMSVSGKDLIAIQHVKDPS